MCHGVDAKGGVSPGLLALDYSKPETLAYVRGMIANGSSSNPAMAPFSQKFYGGPLSEDQIDSLVNFLQYQASIAKETTSHD
jgi:mono/diheme cytochrome c family protein